MQMFSLLALSGLCTGRRVEFAVIDKFEAATIVICGLVESLTVETKFQLCHVQRVLPLLGRSHDGSIVNL